MLGIIGRKIGMTTYFEDSGEAIPCTVIEAGPCIVTRVKTKDTDGYNAIQIGFGEQKPKKVNKAQMSVFKKLKITPVKHLKEIRDFPVETVKVGDMLKVDIFQVGDKVKVRGKSKGRGFQGVVKRHGFGGGVRTHGQSDRERAPGSIGASSYPSRVWKGQRMAGRMGNVNVSVRNLKVIKVFPDSNLLLVKGAVPGPNSGIIEIYK
ncbi:MAG: 50S ribosomal protein L3 [Ignavibacteria bacterium]